MRRETSVYDTHLDVRRRGHELTRHGVGDHIFGANEAARCPASKRKALAAQREQNGTGHKQDSMTKFRRETSHEMSRSVQCNYIVHNCILALRLRSPAPRSASFLQLALSVRRRWPVNGLWGALARHSTRGNISRASTPRVFRDAHQRIPGRREPLLWNLGDRRGRETRRRVRIVAVVVCGRGCRSAGCTSCMRGIYRCL